VLLEQWVTSSDTVAWQQTTEGSEDTWSLGTGCHITASNTRTDSCVVSNIAFGGVGLMRSAEVEQIPVSI
jgi:hypothetical protein